MNTESFGVCSRIYDSQNLELDSAGLFSRSRLDLSALRGAKSGRGKRTLGDTFVLCFYQSKLMLWSSTCQWSTPSQSTYPKRASFGPQLNAGSSTTAKNLI